MGVDECVCGCTGELLVGITDSSSVSLSGNSPISNNRRCSLISSRYDKASLVSRACNISASTRHWDKPEGEEEASRVSHAVRRRARREMRGDNSSYVRTKTRKKRREGKGRGGGGEIGDVMDGFLVCD